MKKIIRFLAVGFLSVVAFSGSASAVRIFSDLIRTETGSRYLLINDDDPINGISWDDAEAFAIEQGGHLVTINDAAEEAWILDNFPIVDGPIMGESLHQYLWTGLNDIASEGTFEWTSGEPVTYTNFLDGEPNNFEDSEDVVGLIRPGEGGWIDFQQDVGNFFNFGPFSGLVEISPIPEPASATLLIGLFGLGCATLRRRL